MRVTWRTTQPAGTVIIADDATGDAVLAWPWELRAAAQIEPAIEAAWVWAATRANRQLQMRVVASRTFDSLAQLLTYCRDICDPAKLGTTGALELSEQGTILRFDKLVLLGVTMGDGSGVTRQFTWEFAG